MKTLTALFTVGALCLAPLEGQEPAREDPVKLVLLDTLRDEKFLKAMREADDERVAAIVAADPKRLRDILFPVLHYAHSNGTVDDRDSFIESLTSRRAVYESITYRTRRFERVGQDGALMSGRATIRVLSNGQPLEIDLNYLAVWQQWLGSWRFRAWQSSRIPPPPPKP